LRIEFIAAFDHGKMLNDRYALPGEWKSIDFLFQRNYSGPNIVAKQWLFSL
jgi:hypothetical protein